MSRQLKAAHQISRRLEAAVPRRVPGRTLGRQLAVGFARALLVPSQLDPRVGRSSADGSPVLVRDRVAILVHEFPDVLAARDSHGEFAVGAVPG